jgi:hypothetical protein
VRVCWGLFFFFFFFWGGGFWGAFGGVVFLGLMRGLLLFGCLLGAFTVLGFGVHEGFGCC